MKLEVLMVLSALASAGRATKKNKGGIAVKKLHAALASDRPPEKGAQRKGDAVESYEEYEYDAVDDPNYYDSDYDKARWFAKFRSTKVPPTTCKFGTTPPPPGSTTKLKALPYHPYIQYDMTPPPCLHYYNPVFDKVMSLCGQDLEFSRDGNCVQK